MDIQKLPQIKKENLFTKIKKILYKIFHNDSNVNKVYENKDTVEIINFKEKIKVEGKEGLIALQNKLKENKIAISDLTDEELDDMIKLYKEQIEIKMDRLKKYRVKLGT